MTEIEKLRNVHRIEWLSEAEGFNINQLIEQIDIFRLLDKAKSCSAHGARATAIATYRVGWMRAFLSGRASIGACSMQIK